MKFQAMAMDTGISMKFNSGKVSYSIYLCSKILKWISIGIISIANFADIHPRNCHCTCSHQLYKTYKTNSTRLEPLARTSLKLNSWQLFHGCAEKSWKVQFFLRDFAQIVSSYVNKAPVLLYGIRTQLSTTNLVTLFI